MSNAAPTDRTEDPDRREVEFRLFAATWHPLDRIPFPALPPQSTDEAPQPDRSPNRISGYF